MFLSISFIILVLYLGMQSSWDYYFFFLYMVQSMDQCGFFIWFGLI